MKPDYRSVYLAAVVGLSVLWPMSNENLTAFQWFGLLVAIELCVIAAAIWCDVLASPYIVLIHAELALLHVVQFVCDPYSSGPSFYALAVPALEGVSLAAVCLTSKTICQGLSWKRGRQI